MDNALVRVADPVFFGYAHERKADIGVKVVNRVNSDESLGVVCLQKSTQEPSSAKDGTADRGDLEELEIDDVEEEEEVEKEEVTTGDPGVSYCHYGVLEYTQMPSFVRAAKDGDELMYRAAHICVNLFSLEYLKKMAEARFQLAFHMASKRIPCTQKDESGNWVTVSTNQPNGIKLEQFIFDAFKYCESEKVSGFWYLSLLTLS